MAARIFQEFVGAVLEGMNDIRSLNEQTIPTASDRQAEMITDDDNNSTKHDIGNAVQEPRGISKNAPAGHTMRAFTGDWVRNYEGLEIDY